MVNPISEFPRSMTTSLCRANRFMPPSMINKNGLPPLSFFRNKSDSFLSPNPTPICQHLTSALQIPHAMFSLTPQRLRRYPLPSPDLWRLLRKWGQALLPGGRDKRKILFLWRRLRRRHKNNILISLSPTVKRRGREEQEERGRKRFPQRGLFRRLPLVRRGERSRRRPRPEGPSARGRRGWGEEA
jgi:hypothetical protein